MDSLAESLNNIEVPQDDADEAPNYTGTFDYSEF
jgi:hypothetical protein